MSTRTRSALLVGLVPLAVGLAPWGAGCAPIDDSEEFEGAQSAEEYISSGTNDLVLNGSGAVVDGVAQWARDASVCIRSDGQGNLDQSGCNCSGTLISPRVVVTNAHCVRSNILGGTFETGLALHTVTFGPRDGLGSVPPGTPASVAIPVIDCGTHPGSGAGCFDGGPTAFCGCFGGGPAGCINEDRDLAVLVLAERVDHRVSGLGTSNYSAIPARVRLQDPNTPPNPDGWNLTWVDHVGYGPISDGGPLPAVRQVVQQQVAVGNFTLCGWSSSYTLGGDRGIPGDSGGGVFSQRPSNGPMEIMGVHRGGTGVQDIGVRLTHSSVQSFLADFIGSHASGYAGTSLTMSADLTIWTGADNCPPRGEAARAAFVDSSGNSARVVDPDGDGLIAANDNCPRIANPEQRDGSVGVPGTGRPTARDVAGDGVADFVDCLGPMLAAAGI